MYLLTFYYGVDMWKMELIEGFPLCFVFQWSVYGMYFVHFLCPSFFHATVVFHCVISLLWILFSKVFSCNIVKPVLNFVLSGRPLLKCLWSKKVITPPSILAPEMYITKETKWQWSCCCHDNSHAVDPVLITTKIPRFHLTQGSSTTV